MLDPSYPGGLVKHSSLSLQRLQHRVGRSAAVTVVPIVLALLACKKKEKPEVTAAGNTPSTETSPSPEPGLLDKLTKREWVTHKSASGGFEVLMPGTPKSSTEETPTAVGSIKLHMYIYEKSNDAAFTAMYSDYPKRLVQMSNPNKILEGAQQGGVSNIKGTLKSEKKIKIGKHPGREFSALAPTPIGTQMEYTSRVYLVENRLYQIAIAASIGKVSDADKKKFFASFKLTE